MESFTNKLKQATIAAFVALVLCFAWPALQPQLAAIWAQVMSQRGQLVDTVPAPAVIVVTPTPQPAAPQPAVIVPLVPTPIIQPAAAPERTVQLAIGETTESYAQFLADCAYAQGRGLRSSPDCPVNAGQMLGQGR